MKKITNQFLALSFLVAALLSPALAQAEKKQEPKPNAELEQRVDELSQAMIAADTGALRELTAEQLSYGHSSGRVENQEEFISNLANGSSDFVSIDLQEQTVEVIGKTGIVRHILAAETNDSGKPGKVRIGVMLVWQKSADQWQLLARQAYKL